MDLLLNSGVTHLTYLDPRVLFQVRELSQFVHLEKQLMKFNHFKLINIPIVTYENNF